MTRNRLEAFSDGVVAILITIMVLELRPPHGGELAALRPLWPVFLSYLLSFVLVGIYWNNHHHMLHTVDEVNGRILWANLHLLFWLSLVPFVTAWMGENGAAALPVALYGLVMVMCALAYLTLQTAIIAAQGEHSRLRDAVRDDRKGKISLVSYLAAVPLAFVDQRISIALYVLVALLWLAPDPRIEKHVTPERGAAGD